MRPPPFFCLLVFLSESEEWVFGKRGPFRKLHFLGILLGGRFLSVLKRCVPKTLAFAFGLRLRS